MLVPRKIKLNDAYFSRALNAWNYQMQDLICELYISLKVFYDVVINTHIYLTVHISSTNTILLNVISAQNLIYIPAFQYLHAEEHAHVRAQEALSFHKVLQ